MLRHVAVFSWKPGTAEAQVEALSAALARLPDRVPGIRAYSFGPDARLGGNADFAVVADFDDEEGYRAYARHPAHVDVIERLLAPIREARSSVQFAYEPVTA